MMDEKEKLALGYIFLKIYVGKNVHLGSIGSIGTTMESMSNELKERGVSKKKALEFVKIVVTDIFNEEIAVLNEAIAKSPA